MNITNADIAAVKLYQAALEELILKHALAVANLTEKQLADAIRQAIVCGDFQRHLCPSHNSQQVVYIPFREHERLKTRIRGLEDELEILRDYDDPREC